MSNIVTSQYFLTPSPMHNMSRHVKKAQKLPNFRVKKHTSEHAFSFFMQFTPLVPNNSKIEHKLKMPHFSLGHCLVWRTYAESVKNDLTTNFNIIQVLQHFCNC